MQCFDSEFAFDLLDKSQAADCNRFRPPRVSHRQKEIGQRTQIFLLVTDDTRVRSCKLFTG